MHVVGARFRTLAAAGAALLAIRSTVTVPPGDAGVRPLGSTRYEESAEDFLLAGRFVDEDVEAVVGIVETAGGRVIERRSDVPRAGVAQESSRGWHATVASNPPLAAAWVPLRTPARPAAGLNATSGARKTGRARSAGPASRARKRPRRPAALLRVRAARAHRSR